MLKCWKTLAWLAEQTQPYAISQWNNKRSFSWKIWITFNHWPEQYQPRQWSYVSANKSNSLLHELTHLILQPRWWPKDGKMEDCYCDGPLNYAIRLPYFPPTFLPFATPIHPFQTWYCVKIIHGIISLHDMLTLIATTQVKEKWELEQEHSLKGGDATKIKNQQPQWLR